MKSTTMTTTSKTLGALALGLTLLGAGTAAAQSPPPAARTWTWPLQQIDRTQWASTGAVVATAPRPNVWSSHVEFQKFTQRDKGNALMIDAHPGIDLRGTDGDLTLFPTAGTIVRASRSDQCGGNRLSEGGVRCRLWVLTPTTGGAKSYLYYLGHIDTGHRPNGTMSAVLRDQLAFANADMVTQDADIASPVAVQAGDRAGQLVPFGTVITGDPNSGWDHLHFGIFDPDDQYSSLEPLAFLARAFTDAGKPQVVLDYQRPVIKNVQLRARTPGSGTVTTGGACGPLLTGTLDITADIKDKFLTSWPPPASFAGDHLPNTTGIKGARWIARRLAGGASAGANWFESPLGCTGTGCGVWRFAMEDRATFVNQAAFFSFLTTNSDSGAPVRTGGAFASRLWDMGLSANDHTSASEVDIIHILTQGVREDGSVLSDGWNTNGGDGRYVVTVEAWDFDNNLSQSSSLVTVGNGGSPTVPAFVQLRDHDQDFGQIPSTVGDLPFWASPDILIADKSTTPSGPRAAPVVVGVDYDVFVRVSNRGCQQADNVQVAVYSALAGTSFSQFKAITTPDGAYAGSATVADGMTGLVGPFPWTPTLADLDNETQGHRCLLAAVTATGDAGPAVTPATWNVQGDPKVAQRNVQFDLLKAYIRNVSGQQKASRLTIDMDGLPVESGTSFELVFTAPAASWPTLDTAWANVAGTELSRTGDQLHVKFKQQKVTLPNFPMPAVSQLLVEAVGVSPQNGVTYSIRLDHHLDDVQVGGMIFQLYTPVVK